MMPGGSAKRLRLAYGGPCVVCSADLAAGSEAYFSREFGIWCVPHGDLLRTSPGALRRRNRGLPEPPAPTPAPPVPPAPTGPAAPPPDLSGDAPRVWLIAERGLSFNKEGQPSGESFLLRMSGEVPLRASDEDLEDLRARIDGNLEEWVETAWRPRKGGGT